MLGVLWWLNQKIFRNLKRRTKILKYINLQRRLNTQKINRSEHKTLSGQLYRKTSNRCFITMDNEKYFSLSHTKIPDHVYYYTSDKSAAPPDIKYKKKSKYEPKIMIRFTVSSKDVCEPYTFIEVMVLLRRPHQKSIFVQESPNELKFIGYVEGIM